MIRTCITIIVVAAALPQAEAERLDGCTPPTSEGTLAHVRVVSSEARALALRGVGYTLTKESLTSALTDPRPEVRSLAAQHLVSDWQIGVLNPVFQAWLSETDTCAKAVMKVAVNELAGFLASDISQLPAGQQRVKPFQACTPSDTPIISLRVEDASSSYPGLTMRISVTNLTSGTLAFVGTRSPEELFSVTVLDPAGAHAEIPESQQPLYDPPSRGASHVVALVGNGPMLVPLSPQEEISWTWNLGNDFDMSAPGTYRVSLGARIPYLNTTVCSNVADVVVK
jgi:hypothetical protein